MFKKKSNFKNFLFSVKNAFDELRTHFYKVNQIFLKIVKISKILKMSWEWF